MVEHEVLLKTFLHSIPLFAQRALRKPVYLDMTIKRALVRKLSSTMMAADL